MKVDGNAVTGTVGQQTGLGPEDLAIAVEDTLIKMRLGSWKGIPLSEPPCLDGRHAVLLDETYAFIMEDQTQIDYPKRTAYVNPEEKTFFLKVEGNTGDLGANPTFWFGPIGFELGGTES